MHQSLLGGEKWWENPSLDLPAKGCTRPQGEGDAWSRGHGRIFRRTKTFAEDCRSTPFGPQSFLPNDSDGPDQESKRLLLLLPCHAYVLPMPTIVRGGRAQTVLVSGSCQHAPVALQSAFHASSTSPPLFECAISLWDSLAGPFVWFCVCTKPRGVACPLFVVVGVDRRHPKSSHRTPRPSALCLNSTGIKSDISAAYYTLLDAKVRSSAQKKRREGQANQAATADGAKKVRPVPARLDMLQEKSGKSEEELTSSRTPPESPGALVCANVCALMHSMQP